MNNRQFAEYYLQIILRQIINYGVGQIGILFTFPKDFGEPLKMSSYFIRISVFKALVQKNILHFLSRFGG
jgi:hypothetical protein